MSENLDHTNLEQLLQYTFKDKNLLIKSLTHTTYAYEVQHEEVTDNQRLEFLGDSILGMVAAEYFYLRYSHFDEGELTRRRSLVVNRNNLSLKAKELDLSTYMLLGKGEEKMGGRVNSTNLSCALEAVIGAIYLDGGFEQAKKFIIERIIE